MNVQGAFTFEKIPIDAGPFLLSAQSHESTPGFSKLITLQENETLENIVIVLNRSFTLTGRIIDQAGKPVCRANLILKREVSGMDWGRYREALPQTVSDETGAFRLKGVPPIGGELGVWKPITVDASFTTNMQSSQYEEDSPSNTSSKQSTKSNSTGHPRISSSSPMPDAISDSMWGKQLGEYKDVSYTFDFDAEKAKTPTPSPGSFMAIESQFEKFAVYDGSEDSDENGKPTYGITPFDPAAAIPVAAGSPGEERNLGDITIDLTKP